MTEVSDGGVTVSSDADSGVVSAAEERNGDETAEQVAKRSNVGAEQANKPAEQPVMSKRRRKREAKEKERPQHG